ncbi:NAD(P)/FAD-dependent oxidoreductase [Pseudohalioglobus sediminis]|uniref:NAD(P)/FAD-dependent oxidoreductase n=1 Tax=Pseudohalioglobus sediminis TaxID=2606449 RepID=A0A5B0WZN7_9GAMM|nr:NAD(P)/FAD-dependent oxidoreductase [Pseudohalioglobus sediminis]KAA1191857.1 NAD(P)/FAD-dependent oxidoreductase [Pseudohalioglobus sediminis]
MNTSQPEPGVYDAVVVGAGIAGLYQLYRLREAGFRVLCLEAAPEVGGTWYWNCYPGARVDSQSYIYQYWFSRELIDEWDWSERFPAQPETERYLNFVADKLALREDIRFNSRVNGANWDADSAQWQISTEQGERLEARFLISCTGMLSAPKLPPFPGAEQFRGTVAHTARYPREGLDLAGKRVGVVGCGATGIQVIQTIASEVAELKVFQRTPSYGVPMKNESFDDAIRDHWRARAGELAERVQHTTAGFDFDFDNGSWYDHDEDERRAVMESAWDSGSLAAWVGSFPEVFTDAEVNQVMSDFARERIRARIDDPELAEKLLPTTYGFGTYRVPLESGYYDVFNRDNVELVDVREAAIESFTATGLQTADHNYELDVVILATGFDAGTGALTQMNIHGRDGLSLSEEWGRDIRSTYGLQVHGFPNLFTVAGPLAPATAFCNMTTCLQQQVDWITDCILHLREHGYRCIEPSRETQDQWVAHHDEHSNQTLLVKTRSWYTGDNIDGKPRRLLSYLGVGDYREICDQVAASGYAGFVLTR